MNHSFVRAGALALAVFAFSTWVQAEDKEDKPRTIKDIMKTTHGDEGHRARAKAAAKAKKWDEAESATKEWVKEAVALSKAEPTRGTAASWKKMTAQYEKLVKSLAEDAANKDARAFNADLTRINMTTCGSCHAAHKPKKR